MKLTTSEKLKVVLGRKKITVKDLADKLGTSRQNLHNKMTRDNFTEKELHAIANALDIQFESHFIMDNGEKI